MKILKTKIAFITLCLQNVKLVLTCLFASDKFPKFHMIVVPLDEELRKKYDLYGEDGLKDDHFGGGGNYQSWHYFNEEFGKS